MTSEAGARPTTRDLGQSGPIIPLLVGSLVIIAVGSLLFSRWTSVTAVVGGGLLLAGLLALAGALVRRRRRGASRVLLWLAGSVLLLSGIGGFLVWAFSSQPEAVDAMAAITRP